MATTTIRVSAETRDLLSRLARTSGTSMQQVLDMALEQYRRRQFLETLNAAYAAARSGDGEVGEEGESLGLLNHGAELGSSSSVAEPSV